MIYAIQNKSRVLKVLCFYFEMELTKLDKIYFTGYRLEHFTGYTSTSAPVYNSLGYGTNNSSYLPSDNYINLTGSDTCISKYFDSNDIDKTKFCFCAKISASGGAGAAKIYIGESNGNGIGIYVYDTGNYSFSFGVDKNNYSGGSTHMGHTSWLYSSTFAGSSWTYLFYVTLSSSDSKKFDTISVTCRSKDFTEDLQTVTGTLSTPIDIECIVFGSIVNSAAPTNMNQFYHCYASNFDLYNTELLKFTSVSSIGSTNQWSGDISTFSTYPVNYSSTGGMSSSYNNTSVSYETSYDLTTKVPLAPLAMILSSNDISSNTSTISPFVTDGTTSITTSDTSIVTQNGNNSTFYLMSDPLTNSDWTYSNIQKYQFGLTKID